MLRHFRIRGCKRQNQDIGRIKESVHIRAARQMVKQADLKVAPALVMEHIMIFRDG